MQVFLLGVWLVEEMIYIYIYPKGLDFFERTSAGIPNGSRARAILFLGSTLQKQNTAYPAIGQKKLNGAASRMMIHFGAVVAHEIQAEHPSEVHRLGFGNHPPKKVVKPIV